MDEKPVKWHLDKKVSISHITATIAGLCAMFVFGSNILSRLSVIESTFAQAILSQRTTDERQDQATKELHQQVREDYKNVSDKLDRLIERVGPR